ncbi:hemerythrin family protein [Thiorhodospira sibirica]|uniref:hemerythrin family protein n=1 Tax=Thiorhodospira sibirica TaxID=154347 RepID=UPI00022C050E|nr:hemerythrin family protein [Thiorhodospira sibirica]
MTDAATPPADSTFMHDDHAQAIAMLKTITHGFEQHPQEEPPGLRQTLRDFIEHSRAHFNREELLMRQTNFPPLQRHKQEHDQRLEQLVACMDDLDAGVITLEELRDLFLNEFGPWYLQHCATMDVATERYIERHHAS